MEKMKQHIKSVKLQRFCPEVICVLRHIVFGYFLPGLFFFMSMDELLHHKILVYFLYIDQFFFLHLQRTRFLYLIVFVLSSLFAKQCSVWGICQVLSASFFFSSLFNKYVISWTKFFEHLSYLLICINEFVVRFLVRHLKGRKLLILNGPHLHCSCNPIGMFLLRVKDEINRVKNFKIPNLIW